MLTHLYLQQLPRKKTDRERKCDPDHKMLWPGAEHFKPFVGFGHDRNGRRFQAFPNTVKPAARQPVFVCAATGKPADVTALHFRMHHWIGLSPTRRTRAARLGFRAMSSRQVRIRTASS